MLLAGGNKDDMIGVVLPVVIYLWLLAVTCVQVNGNDVRHASHQEAVTFLIAPVPDIYLTVRHDPAPPGLQVCYLEAITWLLSYWPSYQAHVDNGPRHSRGQLSTEGLI